ncbi:hypothetical protein F7734_34525 [Scytonema sp. UIC 10036]|uniref:hypothetical protein n=1 Tax=Scytonema sp. UIC 10036 TaxID=2304196 RepID=UPI0012DADB47|nr:hypothetical protein [Scytonema sp. UIC 10036]MUG97174.1 hypothetical protein [Scytonema sp. UIC 10036]
MFTTGAGDLFHTVQSDIQTEAANIAALAFPKTLFQIFSQPIGRDCAALVFPKTQFELLCPKIGSENLSLTFKGKHFSENFRVMFFPKINTLILSGYYSHGTAHLIYIPGSNYNWLNGMGYKITSPDGIGEKFELLATQFYPFLLEFFLG